MKSSQPTSADVASADSRSNAVESAAPSSFCEAATIGPSNDLVVANEPSGSFTSSERSSSSRSRHSSSSSFEEVGTEPRHGLRLRGKQDRTKRANRHGHTHGAGTPPQGGGFSPIMRPGSESPSRTRSRSLSHLPRSPLPESSSGIFPPGIVFGVDIGGTLGKIVFREPEGRCKHIRAQIERLREYFETSNFVESNGGGGAIGAASGGANGHPDTGPTYAPAFGGTLRFLCFETKDIDKLFEIIRQGRFASPEQVSHWKVFATGGGSFKYGARFWSELGVQLRKSDEMETLVSGVECLMDNVADACYTYLPKQDAAPPSPGPPSGAGASGPPKPVPEKPLSYERRIVDLTGARKPWLIVNVGSGVSMLKVDQQQTIQHGPVSTYKRVGGTPLGGGTFLALGCLITGASSHMELLELAEKGDSTVVDKLVGDIYGDEYRGLGLSADTVASNFGKLVTPDARAAVRREDLAAAMLQLVSWNLAQLARLVAQQEGCKTIVFTGSFLHQNHLAQRKIVSAIRYWSNRESVALFMRHEGYVGAVGALAMSSLHPE